MRYYYRPNHPKASPNGFVSAADMDIEPEARALDAPILMDRFYENTVATDGTDIGSRRKHREYMKAKGLTVASDFSGEWAKASGEREALRRGEVKRDQERREQLAKATYNILKP